jgi:hypothetical protein
MTNGVLSHEWLIRRSRTGDLQNQFLQSKRWNRNSCNMASTRSSEHRIRRPPDTVNHSVRTRGAVETNQYGEVSQTFINIRERRPYAIRDANISGVWILIFLSWRRRRTREKRSRGGRLGGVAQTFIGTSCLVLLLFLVGQTWHDSPSSRFIFSFFLPFSHMMKSFLLRESSGILSVLFMFSTIPPVCPFVCVVPLLYNLLCFFLFVFCWLLFKRREY